ncbi:GFA family protein [Devosia sp.]|uniref:GFA family protein n=1 Tax=Devosia sp. TaxID=1871048 RepID=UPI00345D01BF
MTDEIRTGGCLCGAVRYEVRGAPMKSGLCHCGDCRKVTGSSFLAYADWPSDRFSFTGEIATYEGRSFCPKCGSRLFAYDETGGEIYLGTLDDAPNGIRPLVEGWCIRREHWLPVIAGMPMARQDP